MALVGLTLTLMFPFTAMGGFTKVLAGDSMLFVYRFASIALITVGVLLFVRKTTWVRALFFGAALTTAVIAGSEMVVFATAACVTIFLRDAAQLRRWRYSLRELMELFVLGVNKYTEDDVKSISRVLTGYQVSRNGDVAINQNRRDKGSVTLLGRTSSFTGDSLSEFLTARDEATTFIAERLWYRFISSTETMPTSFTAKKAFADRSIAAAVTAMASDSAMRDKKNDMVKAPVEWFISACRALELTPSNLISSAKLINYLTKLGQVPFSPPSVGGWPAGEAWLSSATAQYRIEFATWLIAQSDLRVLKELPVGQRIEKSADWLGVAEWSPRTQTALGTSINNPQQFALLALCSPEYIVNA
jgi:uncharacterized protein (DUF1800 family)